MDNKLQRQLIYVFILGVIIYLFYKYWTYSNVKYWLGPYDIRVPISIKEIVAKDGYNTLYQNGGETQVEINSPITESAYKKKYAIYDANDGYYYWII